MELGETTGFIYAGKDATDGGGAEGLLPVVDVGELCNSYIVA